MNEENFKALSKSYHVRLDDKQVELLKKIGELVDLYEAGENKYLGVSIIFKKFNSDYPKFFWNGEIFYPKSLES